MTVFTLPQGSPWRRDEDTLAPSSQDNIGASVLLVGLTRCVFSRSRCVFVSLRCVFSWSCCVFISLRCVFSRSCCVFVSLRCVFSRSCCVFISLRCVFSRSCCVFVSLRCVFSWSCCVFISLRCVFSRSCCVFVSLRCVWRLLRRVTSSMASVNSCVGCGSFPRPSRHVRDASFSASGKLESPV